MKEQCFCFCVVKKAISLCWENGSWKPGCNISSAHKTFSLVENSATTAEQHHQKCSSKNIVIVSIYLPLKELSSFRDGFTANSMVGVASLFSPE